VYGGMAPPVERSCRGDFEVVDDPPAVVLLEGGQAVEVGRDHLVGEQRPCRAVGVRRQVERVQRLVLGPALDAQLAVGRNKLLQSGEPRLCLLRAAVEKCIQERTENNSTYANGGSSIPWIAVKQ
jgi:hypothetical protein